MIKLANAQLWVHDQDEALAFYVDKLGWEVRSDVTIEQWAFRWLEVAPSADSEVGVVLMPIPGPPMLDADSGTQLAGLVSKGFGGTIFLSTDDCQASYDELKAKGVEFVDEPTRQPYGIDASFRDPSGNHLRLTQLMEFDMSMVGG